MSSGLQHLSWPSEYPPQGLQYGSSEDMAIMPRNYVKYESCEIFNGIKYVSSQGQQFLIWIFHVTLDIKL